MSARVIIVPYKMYSKAAKALKESLVAKKVKCFRIKHTSQTYRPRRSDVVLYYGGRNSARTLGKTVNVCRNIALDKLATFRVLSDQGISTVPWTTDREVAKTWKRVVCRGTLTGHSGQGISLWDRGEDLIPTVPLYTKYTRRSHEYRIHVFNGTVIDSQVKRKVRDVTDVNKYIRNKHTGWVYCREDFTPTDTLKQLAISAVAAVELDFGAVDIIYSKRDDTYYVLEINTAPGLEGTTLTNYVEAISNAYCS